MKRWWPNSQDSYKTYRDYITELRKESAPTVSPTPYTTKNKNKQMTTENPTHCSSWTWRGESGAEKKRADCWDLWQGWAVGESARIIVLLHVRKEAKVPANALMPPGGLASNSGSTLQLNTKEFKDRRETCSGFLLGGFVTNWRTQQWENKTYWYMIPLSEITVLIF